MTERQAVVQVGVPNDVSVTKALAAAGNYAAGDVVSESASAGTTWNWANVVKTNGGHGFITKATALLETTALTPRFTVFLFDTDPTSAVTNDNVANTAPLHADAATFVGAIEFPAMKSLGTGDSYAVAQPGSSSLLPLEFKCASGDRDLYAIVATRDAITGETATDDLIIVLTIRED